MSLGIFKKGKGVFGDSANNPVEPEDIYLLKMPTSTADLINNGEDRQHPFITANDIVGGNGTAIISGDIITWLREYTYNVPPYTYLIRGTAYETQAVEIPLDPANADPNLDRIDVIVATFDAEGNGVIGVIKGQESAVAVKPTINYDTQIELTFIPVDGNTTQPASVTNLVVYDENVEFVTSDNTTGRVDFEFTTSPFSSSLCLAVTDFATGDEIKFTSPAPFAPFNFGGLQFQIQPTSGFWKGYGTFKIGFFNGDVLNGTWVTVDSSLTNLAGNPYAFNSASATWQNIGIGLSSFGLPVNTADNIRFVKTDNTSAESFKLDLIRMQAGIVVSARPILSKTYLSEFINDGNGDINFPFITAQDVVLPQFRVTDVSAEYTGTGLEFWVRGDVFPVNGKYETATPNFVTLLNGDPDFDRFDLIVAIAPVYPATVGTVGKVTGIASANPEQPLWDFGTMYPIKYVLVTQGATTPIGFIDETIWNENTGEPTEWTFSTNKPTDIYVVANNSMDGSSAINYTNLSGFNTIRFQNDALVSTEQTKLLTFYIKLKAIYDPNEIIVVMFNQGLNATIAMAMFKHGQYGFDANKLTYQKITIDISLLGINSVFDNLRFGFSDTGHAGLYMDWVRIQSSPTIDIPIVTDVPTRTSQLINDGNGDPSLPFITTADIPTPNLQQVLDAGYTAITNNGIKIFRTVSPTNYSQLNGVDFIISDTINNRLCYRTAYGDYYYDNNVGGSLNLRFHKSTATNDIFNFPEKPTGTYTLATLDDIPTGGGGVESVTGTAVDNTDPLNPVVNSVIGNLQQVFEQTALQGLVVSPTGEYLDITVQNNNANIDFLGKIGSTVSFRCLDPNGNDKTEFYQESQGLMYLEANTATEFKKITLSPTEFTFEYAVGTGYTVLNFLDPINTVTNATINIPAPAVNGVYNLAMSVNGTKADANGNITIATGGGGVASVTGTTVNNTDPLNPVINIPTLDQLLTFDHRAEYNGSIFEMDLFSANPTFIWYGYDLGFDEDSWIYAGTSRVYLQHTAYNPTTRDSYLELTGDAIEMYVTNGAKKFKILTPATVPVDTTLTWANKAGSWTIPLSVNGITADANGNITVTTGSSDNLQKEVTTNYSIVVGDNKYTLFLNSATPITVTIDIVALNNFECDFYNLGAGLVTFANGTATVDYPDGTTLATDKVCSLMRFMATTIYKLKGELA